MSGVPQDSNLGSLLFLISVDDISENINVDHHIFADEFSPHLYNNCACILYN